MHELVPDDANRKVSNDQINVQLNTVEQQVLSIVIENPSLILGEIALSISKTAKPVQRCLNGLREKNIIR